MFSRVSSYGVTVSFYRNVTIFRVLLSIVSSVAEFDHVDVNAIAFSVRHLIGIKSRDKDALKK